MKTEESLVNTHQLNALLTAVFKAGRVIMAIRERGVKTLTKNDGSPVTLADQQAEVILLHAIHQQFPQIPIIAEEAAEAGKIPTIADRFFLVDPLDGTKEFIQSGTDFTVNIGLIEHGMPVFGIVYAPASGQLYVGETPNRAWQAHVDCLFAPDTIAQQTLQVAQPDQQNIRAVASRSHRDEQTNNWLQARNIAQVVAAGSSIKFCVLARGDADVYPRFGPTMQWDTAAGHAVLLGAGGQVMGVDGQPFLYGKTTQERPFLNPGFIACGGWRE